MLGGLLGAEKTTTLGRVARHYQEQGQKVGIITNDQANNLVDTHNFRVQGRQRHVVRHGHLWRLMNLLPSSPLGERGRG